MQQWNWRRMGAVARKEWTHLRRDPQSLGVILLLPLVTLILYGYAINFDLKHIPLGILDHDRSPRSPALLTSTTVARERERGTLEQLVTSPVQPLELMVGKLVPYILTGMADVVLLIGFGYALFHVWPAGSLLLLMAGMLLFLAGVMGL